MTLRPGILVAALCHRQALSPVVWELLAAGRSLADSSGQALSAVLAGGTAEQARELVERGADRVYWIQHPALDAFNEELHAAAVLEVALKQQPGRILLPANVAGRSLAARLAVKLDAGLATDVTSLAADGRARRSHYSGNLIADVEFLSPTQVLTLSPMAFPAAPRTAGRSGEVEKIPFEPAPARTEFVSFQAEEAGELDLGSAERIVSGGRGVGSPEGFSAIRGLAHALGAAVGASRAAVDSGWIPYRHQVGLTGRTVRPKLYLACGISGQIQHLAGMSGSAHIVAINSDPACPMMQLATVSVTGDMFELIPLIIAEVQKRSSSPVAA
ncbi:MAG: electron transfer flavoprotein subunit alpha/FixB family protein [Elusimicrobiota bacterium]|jgi:electron transfer flavoprotein alpha subunit